MLLSSVILVLREVLEAALLFSLLMAMAQRLELGLRWVPKALLAGLTGAAIYALVLEYVSDWFDGVGQEVLNAVLQFGVYALICAIAVYAVRHLVGGKCAARPMLLLLGGATVLAVVREGSEVLIYLSGFLAVRDQLPVVLAGSLIGAGIGMSAGAVFYYLLLSLRHGLAVVTGSVLLALVAAGMVLQATQMLIQADWLPSSMPIWDTSWLVDEQRITGQVLYALIGYEATPTALQIALYLASLAVLALFGLLTLRLARTRPDHDETNLY